MAPDTASEAGNSVVVAEATEADITAIAGFFWEGWRASGPDAPGWAGASEEAIAEITDPGAILARLGGPRRMFLARRDNRVVGFSATRVVDEGTVELAGIIVSAGMHGLGIGTALLRSALDAVTAEGFRNVVVKTEAANQTALSFYRANGFADSRVIVEDVEGTSMELVELRRAL